MNLWQFLIRFLRRLFNWQEAAAQAVRAGAAPSESVARPVARAAYESIRQATIYRDLPDEWIPHAQVPIRDDIAPFTYETEILAVWEFEGIQRAQYFTVAHGETATWADIQDLLREQIADLPAGGPSDRPQAGATVTFIPVSVVRGYWR